MTPRWVSCQRCSNCHAGTGIMHDALKHGWRWRLHVLPAEDPCCRSGDVARTCALSSTPPSNERFMCVGFALVDAVSYFKKRNRKMCKRRYRTFSNTVAFTAHHRCTILNLLGPSLKQYPHLPYSDRQNSNAYLWLLCCEGFRPHVAATSSCNSISLDDLSSSDNPPLRLFPGPLG